MIDIKNTVNKTLDAIESKYGVEILFAAETGSRATGLESPDSDYDVRFIYKRRMEDYLCVNDIRDVIEYRTNKTLDVNGWDVRKALQSIEKGNPSIIEWTKSPIIYRKRDKWDIIDKTADRYFSERDALFHYYGKAQNTYKTNIKDEEYITYKKYYYVLHALLCCRWIERYHTVPPVRFEDILCLFHIQDENLTDALYVAVKSIFEQKGAKNEYRPQIPIIYEFIQTETARQIEIAKNTPSKRKPDYKDINDVFRAIVMPSND